MDEPRAEDRSSVRLADVTKSFGQVIAVDDLSLEIDRGEFFTLLGPSGCGKTTTLRMIGGFESPDTGRIVLDGQDVRHVPSHKRNVRTVFQNYALFPHMTVFENIAYPLRRAKEPEAEIRRRVGEALELVRLPQVEERRPTQLSGGQQQRVALARALVGHPAVLLLDEPLGALDAKLRKAMQLELKALQQQVGITFIYVTHDQDEALTMSDRIAVMRSGRVEQVAPPVEIYERPTTLFVADFIGSANFFEGSVTEAGEEVAVALPGGTVARGHAAQPLEPGTPAVLVVRSERLRLADPDERSEEVNVLSGRVHALAYLGTHLLIEVTLPDGRVATVFQQAGHREPPDQGAPVAIGFDVRHARVFAGERSEVEGARTAAAEGEEGRRERLATR